MVIPLHMLLIELVTDDALEFEFLLFVCFYGSIEFSGLQALFSDKKSLKFSLDKPLLLSMAAAVVERGGFGGGWGLPGKKWSRHWTGHPNLVSMIFVRTCISLVEMENINSSVALTWLLAL
ncbi:hypothetical protein K1719_014875 [Acacia pycnantha]|nr:hypothetical protein K1719_014875 [Acacia pycnantha]